MLTPQNSHPTTSLITGVNGFVGTYLSGYLSSMDRSVTGIDVQEKCVSDKVRYFQGDIRDDQFILDVFQQTRPQEIYHLAAVSSPQKCADAPFDSFQINLMGSISQFEAMRKICPESTMLIVGSAKQYQRGSFTGKISEASPLDPTGYYGVSKNVVEMMAKFYIEQHSLDIRLTRSFNHTGPKQSPDFVCSEWARNIARIESLKAMPHLSIGNIDEVIDFCDVRDVVEAYRLIVELGKPGEAYNVCSGKGIPLRYILEYLKAKSSLKDSITVQSDRGGKPETNVVMIGDNHKIRAATGWLPKIPIEKTLDDLYNWWLSEIKDPR